jgi:hypothetical protein
MSMLMKGLIVAALQLALAASVGAKFLYDRSNYPRVWVETAPFDPFLPIRGRYLSIALKVETARRVDRRADGPATFMGVLEVHDGRLYAIEDPYGRHWVRQFDCGESKCWQLSTRLAFFIPEHAVDPSRRPEGEALWVEVTVPPKGAPRPIRLGVRREGDAEVTPLDVQIAE